MREYEKEKNPKLNFLNCIGQTRLFGNLIINLAYRRIGQNGWCCVSSRLPNVLNVLLWIFISLGREVPNYSWSVNYLGTYLINYGFYEKYLSAF